MKLFGMFLMFFVIATILLTFSSKEDNATVCFNKKCIEAEIADTPETRITGLMFRENLPKDKGMLFIYDKEGIRSFWMKNTNMPLDIIWVSKNFTIKHIEHAIPCNTEKCLSYKSLHKAKYVLETNAGFTDRYDVKVDDKITIVG